ncbi:hypothetical protein WICMUC_002784 [Wickerhamomyces mucosus]|uniref:t-SNARE coiled-coil homology domain-containing protein n=1 Tax=Wickerhamomyces mucosus TaxID=1378264 RepID=A0A9P8PN04_9ASCO|nr:hypothetical protein WICMUC_002784 [Wickerhamomyces mucosus]
MSNKLPSLRLLESYLEDVSSYIEESNRLISLDLSSEETDYELKKTLLKTHQFLQRNDDGEDYDELVERYNELLNQCRQFDIKEFEYHRVLKKSTIKKDSSVNKKSVRFNENIEFQPFKDNPSEEAEQEEQEESNKLFQNRTISLDEENNEDNFTNQQIFIQHQQSLQDQDHHLSNLSGSIKRQHELGISINDELQDQNILLNDLEAQLDQSDSRLKKGQKKLEYFSKKAKENREWFTIIVLIFILVLLLIVLK